MFTNIQVKGMDNDFVSLDEKKSLREKIGDIKRYLDLPDSKQNPEAQLEFLMRLYPSGHPYHEALVEVLKEKWSIARQDQLQLLMKQYPLGHPYHEALVGAIKERWSIARKERLKKEAQEAAGRTPVVVPIKQQVRKNTIPSTNSNQRYGEQQKVSPMPTVRAVQPMQDLSKGMDDKAFASSARQMQDLTKRHSGFLPMDKKFAEIQYRAQIKNKADQLLKANEIFVYQDGTLDGIAVPQEVALLSVTIQEMLKDLPDNTEDITIPLPYSISTIKIVFDFLNKLYKKDEVAVQNIADNLSLENLIEICQCLSHLDVPLGNELIAERVIQIIKSFDRPTPFPRDSIGIEQGIYDKKLDVLMREINTYVSEMPPYTLLNNLSLGQQKAVIKDYLFNDNIHNYNMTILRWESGGKAPFPAGAKGAVRRLYSDKVDSYLKSKTPLVDLINKYKRILDRDIKRVKDAIAARKNRWVWFWQR